LVTYDTRADDDAAWGLGLGCNGLIDVLLEPMTPPLAGDYSRMLGRALDADRPSVLATVMESGNPESTSVGAHVLVMHAGVESLGRISSSVSNSISSDADEALNAGRRGLVREYGQVQVAFEVVHPAIQLLICGSGPDVIPLVRFGTELGWNVTVVDHRPVQHAHPERFPGARVMECADALELAKFVTITARTAAVVMSHHFGRDTDYVRALLGSDALYIGVLGPRARAERMLADMRAAGDSVVDGDRLFAPIGMDIGGDGPDAIALSVIAEVSAVTGGRGGGHLRDRRGSLHGSVAEDEGRRTLRTQD
jgi:xanthine/CO dehydrogenase XdhC/CoxF family maturation factor